MNRKTRARIWWATAALSALLTACIGWVIFDDLFAPLANRGESVEIPDFCGIYYDSISIPDWMEVEFEYRYDVEAAEGIVLAQTPTAGNRRKLTAQNSKVQVVLTVSMGREALQIPDLIGRDVREAERILREQGFAVSAKQVQSAYPLGQVLEMQPRADSLVPKGSEILLTVSAGIQNDVTEVPDLHGLSRSDALIALWLAKLNVGEVVEEDSLQPSGTVIRQSHQAGTRVRASTKITIYVSRERWDEE